MKCISQRNNQINLAHYNETKKRAHDSQIARAKENLKSSYDGPSQVLLPFFHKKNSSFFTLFVRVCEFCNSGHSCTLDTYLVYICFG